jgi:hypothetical protein
VKEEWIDYNVVDFFCICRNSMASTYCLGYVNIIAGLQCGKENYACFPDPWGCLW